MPVRLARPWLALALLVAVAAAHGGQAPPYKPQFPGDPARSRDEALALAYMRTVVNAQRLYAKKYGKYARTLTALVGTGSVTRRMTETDRGAYKVSFRGSDENYSLALTPGEFQPGRRAFFVDESGNIRVDEQEPATVESAILRQDPEDETENN